MSQADNGSTDRSEAVPEWLARDRERDAEIVGALMSTFPDDMNPVHRQIMAEDIHDRLERAGLHAALRPEREEPQGVSLDHPCPRCGSANSHDHCVHCAAKDAMPWDHQPWCRQYRPRSEFPRKDPTMTDRSETVAARDVLAHWLWQFNEVPGDGEATATNFREADELLEHLRACRLTIAALRPEREENEYAGITNYPTPGDNERRPEREEAGLTDTIVAAILPFVENVTPEWRLARAEQIADAVRAALAAPVAGLDAGLAVYESVLRGLRSENDTLQLRAIIASVEADRDRFAARLTADRTPETHDAE